MTKNTHKITLKLSSEQLEAKYEDDGSYELKLPWQDFDPGDILILTTADGDVYVAEVLDDPWGDASVWVQGI